MTAVALLPNHVWFFGTLNDAMVNPGLWTLAKVYRLSPGVSERAAQAAVSSVWKHHDSLRARFRRTDGEWRQEIGEPDTPAPFRSADLSLIPAAERGSLIGQLAHDVAGSISITGESLARFLFLSPGPDDAPRLVFAAHHLVLDAFSLRVVTADLGAALTALGKGVPVRLPRGARYDECVEALHDFAQAGLAHELDHWAALPWRHAARPPAGPRAANALRLWQTRTEQLAPGLPAWDAAQAPKSETVLAAIGAVLTEWTGCHTWVQSVHHGRDLVTRDGRQVLPARAWRTVGWFATGGLRLLPHYQGQGIGEYARSLAAAEPPNHGVGLSLMHWLKPVPGAEEMTSTIMADSWVLFNYFSPRPQATGTPDMIAEAPELVEGYHDLLEPRLDVYIRVRNDDHGLTTHWDFDPTAHHPDVVGRLASRTACLLADRPTD